MDKIKLGIVGLNRGTVHIKNALACPSVELTAVCDLDRAKADAKAAQFGIPKVYYDHRELLADSGVDAVVMATPIDVHAQTVVDALEAGKHVLSEVIVATTLPDIDRIGAAVKSSGKKYMMAENYCCIRPLLIVGELIRRGMLGEIYYAESDYLKDFQEYNPNFPNIGGWRQKTYFGRRGHPYITHSLGPLLNIMNEKIANVSCMAAGHSFDMTADNTCALMMTTDCGHLVRLRSSFVSPRPDSFTYYSFQGTDGCYQAPQGPTDFHKVYIKGLCKPGEWKNVYEFADLCSPDWRRHWTPADYASVTDADPYALYDTGALLMLEQFASCVINDTPSPIPFSAAANWTAAGLISADSVDEASRPLAVPAY